MVIPQERRPEYDEHDALRAEAERRALRFADPARIDYLERLAARDDWASRVLGFYCHGLRDISSTDAELLAVAHERGIDPPEPTWMAEDRRLAEQRREARRQTLLLIARRDDANWAAALAAAPAGVAAVLEVYCNTTARVRHGTTYYLGHAVPNVDVYSGARKVRTHPAGRALCESSTRPSPLLLESTPSTGPATCTRCLAWTVKVRTVR